MKLQHLYIFLLLLILSACDVDDDWEWSGIMPETYLYDKWDTKIGTVYSNNRVENAKDWKTLGSVNRDGKVYFGGYKEEYPSYMHAGYIEQYNETTYKVEDRHYKKVGTVNITNGEVKNASDDIVGYGTGDKLWQAGVILLLFDQ